MVTATIWCVWIFLAIGVLGWAMQVVVSAVGMKDAPAWFQAVGSVGAVVAAIWISERNHSRDRQAAEQAGRIEVFRVAGLAERAIYSAWQAVQGLPNDVEQVVRLRVETVNIGRLERATAVLMLVLQQRVTSEVATEVHAVLAHIAALSPRVESWRAMQIDTGWRDLLGGHANAIHIRLQHVRRLHKGYADVAGQILQEYPI